MNSLINNFENGNLTDAKAQAEKFSMAEIAMSFLHVGYSSSKAAKTAEFLKGRGTFQAACDAV